MNQVRLDEIIQFSLGKNITRIKDSAAEIYTQEDFECDLKSSDEDDERYGCIINLIKSKAAPVSGETKDKILTQNFMKCILDETKILPWYFCYKFNEGKKLEQQISMYHQGTTLSVKKLNVKIIGDLIINLPDIEKQRLLGEIYRKSIIQYELSIKNADAIKKYTLEMLERIEED